MVLFHIAANLFFTIHANVKTIILLLRRRKAKAAAAKRKIAQPKETKTKTHLMTPLPIVTEEPYEDEHKSLPSFASENSTNKKGFNDALSEILDVVCDAGE